MSISDRMIKSELAKYEEVIERSIVKTLEGAIAMKAILDKKLYQGQYKTFESYVDERWGFTRQRAYQLIAAAEVTANLSTAVDKSTCPQNEWQLREVAKAPVEKQAEVVKKATEKAAEENRKPTAADYKHAVSELLDKEGKPVRTANVVATDGKPALSKEEQVKADRKKARSYAEYLQRSIDDLNHIKRNPTLHPELIKLCSQILEGLEKW
jgi:hypothetical protein